MAVAAWEAELASPVKPCPYLMFPMAHEYTEQTLSFSGLKGRDAEIVAVLRDQCGLDCHLALVEKYESGTASGGDYDRGYDRYDRRRERWGGGEDEEESYDEDDGEGASMEDVDESTISVKKIIAEDDSEAGLKGLDLDFDGLGLISDDGNPFDDLDPYKSEYEAYTGNAGPTLEQWYRTCVCVIWPSSQARCPPSC
jgi:hypothetical protein